MGPLRWKLLPTILLVLLWLSVRPSLSVVASDEGDLDPVLLEEPVAVSLAELRRDPSAWVGTRVLFTVQFRSIEDDWNPGLTRFGRGDWVAFSGWADERFTWELEVFETPMTRLFSLRGSPWSELLGAARPYERFELVATVREVFFEQPWIEVERVTPLLEMVAEGTILHVGRAYEFVRREQWGLALEQFKRATSAPLPAHARKELGKKIADCTRLRDSEVGTTQ